MERQTVSGNAWQEIGLDRPTVEMLREWVVKHRGDVEGVAKWASRALRSGGATLAQWRAWARAAVAAEIEGDELRPYVVTTRERRHVHEGAIFARHLADAWCLCRSWCERDDDPMPDAIRLLTEPVAPFALCPVCAPRIAAQDQRIERGLPSLAAAR